MPKSKFDYYDVPGFVVKRGEEESVSYRFEGTGRGKAAAERWQRRVRTRVYLDGYTVAEVIDFIAEVAVGLEDTYFDNEAKEEYGSAWTETSVSGWKDVVFGVAEVVHANEEIAAVKRYVQERYAESQDVASRQRAKAEAEIKSLAYRYPDLVAQYAPRATAG